MKIMTIVGTRPELIRLSLIIPKLDQFCDHILVDTNQNYSDNLSKIFYDQLRIRKPDYCLNVRGSFAEQISGILTKLEKIIELERPDKFYVLGDTNSSTGCIVAKRMGVKVYHSEAGNRCYNNLSPEEVNRKIIDHTSDILLPYSNNSKDRLLREGIKNDQIFVTGNPIYEVILHHLSDKKNKIKESDLKKKYNIESYKYFLVTLHREENIDYYNKLKEFFKAFEKLSELFPVIISAHPRLMRRLTEFEMTEYLKHSRIKLLEPFNFIEFVNLEMLCSCILTDSGTVMEEATILKIPNVILRDFHERPECQEAGSSIISGCDCNSIVQSVKLALKLPCDWVVPPEYLRQDVSSVITKILLSK